MKIAYFGTGSPGAGFVRHLLELGHEVNVWNRSAAKASALEEYGAKAFASRAEAVRGVEQLHLTLADDTSVDAVLEPIADAIAPTTWIVDHTPHGPDAHRRAGGALGRAREALRPRPGVHGPAQRPRGDGCHARLRREVALRGPPADPGEDDRPRGLPRGGAGRAAAFKLFGNLVIISSVEPPRRREPPRAGARHPDRRRHGPLPGLQPRHAAARPRGQARRGRLHAVVRAHDGAQGRAAELEEASRHGAELLVVPGVAAMLDAALAHGDGASDMVAMAKA